MRLESSPDGGAIVHYNSESSLVVKVKSKQNLDLALMELKELVFGKFKNHSPWGGWCAKVPSEIMCSLCRRVADFRKSTWVPLLNLSGVHKNVP